MFPSMQLHVIIQTTEVPLTLNKISFHILIAYWKSINWLNFYNAPKTVRQPYGVKLSLSSFMKLAVKVKDSLSTLANIKKIY